MLTKLSTNQFAIALASPTFPRLPPNFIEGLVTSINDISPQGTFCLGFPRFGSNKPW
ncbi:hypothetical protein BMETH_1905_1 [methanotrophic bacterial endosymbiont of Bathymodiolus sp.]|nr:hypothetical protein BMETH_1905_1 [methanotrophic bacterial endosymbiont of Bathymodiolus sp.]